MLMACSLLHDYLNSCSSCSALLLAVARSHGNAVHCHSCRPNFQEHCPLVVLSDCIYGVVFNSSKKMRYACLTTPLPPPPGCHCTKIPCCSTLVILDLNSSTPPRQCTHLATPLLAQLLLLPVATAGGPGVPGRKQLRLAALGPSTCRSQMTSAQQLPCSWQRELVLPSQSVALAVLPTAGLRGAGEGSASSSDLSNFHDAAARRTLRLLPCPASRAAVVWWAPPAPEVAIASLATLLHLDDPNVGMQVWQPKHMCGPTLLWPTVGS
jgi:hypothetical protein